VEPAYVRIIERVSDEGGGMSSGQEQAALANMVAYNGGKPLTCLA
jgi:hypothetical protein